MFSRPEGILTCPMYETSGPCPPDRLMACRANTFGIKAIRGAIGAYILIEFSVRGRTEVNNYERMM